MSADEEKPVKLQALYDAGEVKRILDEAASQTVVDAGYPEDFWLSDVKIGLGLLTCASALVAQFYPLPFPRNYWLLVACVTLYFLLNTALQAFCYFIEGDIILLTRPKQGAVSTDKGLRLSSSLQRFGHQYTLTLRARGSPTGMPARMLCKSVSAWIHEDGELNQAELKADVLKLLDGGAQEQQQTGGKTRRTKRD